MNPVLSELKKIGLVPVVVLDDAKDAEALGQALINGGLPCAEVTFRTEAAEESIRILSQKFPEMLVGAGTVLTTDQVDRAVNAGAKFIVAPGLNPTTVQYCLDKNIPFVPGISNASDIEMALSFGLDVVKFFPAEQAGGIKMIKALAAPYTNVQFMPTGGINADNLSSYISFNKILACGGSWMVAKALVKDGKFDEIERLTAQAVQTMLGFELVHVGINHDSEADCANTVNFFANALGMPITKDGPKSTFCTSLIECMKSKGPGKNGHLAIATNSVERAVYFLQKKGFEFDESTATYKDGVLNFIYFKNEIAGFGVHLIGKNK